MPDLKPKDRRRPALKSPYDITYLATLTGLERISGFVDLMRSAEQDAESRSWMAEILPHLTTLSVSPATPDKGPTVLFRMEVVYVHSNAIGNMQGGCASTVFDYCTSLALGLVNSPGRWFFLGLTRNLNVTMLRPIPIGESILIEGEVVNAGKNLAHLKGRIRRESDGTLLAICEHEKVNSDPPAPRSRPDSKI